jgi:hypothetical protein
VPIDPSSQSVQQGVNKLHVKGMSTAQITQAVQQVEKQHGVIVFDLHNAGTNMNAYCTESGDNDTGSAAVPFIEQAISSQLGQYGAQDVTQKSATIGGVPGVRTSYHLPASGVTFYGGQLEVAPKPDRICFVTLTGSRDYFPASDLSVAAATARFP